MQTRRVKTIRAIHPNAGVAAWYREQLNEALNEAHIDLALRLSLVFPRERERPKVVQQLAHDIKRVRIYADTSGLVRIITGYRYEIAMDAAPAVTSIRKTLKTWGDKWARKFDALAPRVAKSFATKSFVAAEIAFKSALRDAGFTVQFKATRASINAYKAVVAENVGLIRSIPQQYLTNVESLVWQSVRAGSDMASLSVKLREQYGVTTRRAALISRDQNAKAKATIENTRRQELGIREAIWQHSNAGKVPRPEHVAMNGKTFELAKGMWDPVEKAFILPGQLINCRCTSRAVIPGIVE